MIFCIILFIVIVCFIFKNDKYEELKYSVGDKVLIVKNRSKSMSQGMAQYCGNYMTIKEIAYGSMYYMEETGDLYAWLDHDIERIEVIK